MLRPTWMCRPNGSSFHQKSIDDMGHISVKKKKKSLEEEGEKSLGMGKDFRPRATHPRQKIIRVAPPPGSR